MLIVVNGKGRQAEGGITISQLLSDLSVDAKNVAVELNLRILNKSEYGLVKLKENDQVEIVHPVGGGNENRNFALSTKGLDEETLRSKKG